MNEFETAWADIYWMLGDFDAAFDYSADPISAKTAWSPLPPSDVPYVVIPF